MFQTRKHLKILSCVYCAIALQVSSLIHGCVLGFTLHSNQKVCFLTCGTMYVGQGQGFVKVVMVRGLIGMVRVRVRVGWDG